VEIIIPYKERDVFKEYHRALERWRVIVAHRRCGKTVACVNDLIKSMMQVERTDPPARVAYIAPLLKQAKDVAWIYVKQYTANFPGRKVNETELSVTVFGDRRIRLYGADDPDSIRGLYLDAVVLDEYAQFRPRFLDEVLWPMLMDYQGKVTVIGTPMGRNEFFELYDDAAKGFWTDKESRTGARHPDPDYKAWMFKASETGIIPEFELERYKHKVSPNRYMQEMECSFDAAIEGAYYGALLEAAEREGRICQVPHRADLPVYTAWDLGVGDDTSIWFCQRVGGFLHIIDWYSNHGYGANHYVDVLRERGYNYAAHYLPHDAENKEFGSGLKRIDVIRSLGLKNVKILPRVPPDDGINAVRMLLPTMRFDAVRCAGGLESLRQYRREYDEQRRTFKPAPLHDWTSHDADAMRYLVLGLEPEKAGASGSDEYGRGDYGRRKRWVSGQRWPSPKSWMSG